MMTLSVALIVAFLLDLLFGEPSERFHRIVWIGRFAKLSESLMRRIPLPEIATGVLCASLVIFGTYVLTWTSLFIAGQLHHALEFILMCAILFSCLALRSLVVHARDVKETLNYGDLLEARKMVSKIVSRDTSNLSREEIIRATVESVAENVSDGVTAPLFYGFLLGPVGMLTYKVINTLDSTFGYKTDQYKDFGFFSAKLDDVANYLPARITSLCIPLAAALIGLNTRNSFKMLLRDRRKHESPNAGLSEAAFAGALSIQLGGLSYYFGTLKEKPTLGEPHNELTVEHIIQANSLAFVTSLVYLIGCFLLSMFIIGLGSL